MKKLWDKENKFDPIIEAFETGGDLLMDQKLVVYDVQGSLAHANMLYKIGILSKGELESLEKGLNEVLNLYKQGKFTLVHGDEDVHTKIENFLTKKYGDVGKKIHTGRSRNDQVLTALRLYEKAMLTEVQKNLKNLINSFQELSKNYGNIAMPGYTHMQKAMPSTIGIWLGSFISSLQDDANVVKAAYDLIDQSPLGSAAGYGVPIKLDKKYTAAFLGFAKVQENPLYCQNAKGKFEAIILASLINILLTINKFAADMMLFTTSEFNFFTVSEKVTTGSSIMPQKKNLDVAELLRSKVHIVLSNYTQIVSMSVNLVSGYNRDLQDIKKPLVESLEITLNSLKAAYVLINNITPNEKALKNAMTDDLYATEKALDLASKGVPFRDAYGKIKGGLLLRSPPTLKLRRAKGGEKNEK
ncbi:MAG: argininosuccinate lyase [Candidatus Levybacteria bacterium]|nr:argininosuccinate lyase [Candidatus Levybacteria bacterium]